MKINPNTELSWLGHVLLPGIFDGEHLFIMKKNADKETLFIHEENFSGLLCNPVIKKFGSSTEAGFVAMNQALKKRCETIL